MTSEPTECARRTPSDDEIPSLLATLAASGGNTAAFAREHGLALWKLYEAQRVASGAGPRRRRRPKAPPDFVPIKIVEDRTPPSDHLELLLGSGHRLLIPSGFDETTLRCVLGVLASC